MSERILTYRLSDLPPLLTRGIPKKSKLHSCLFYLARDGSRMAKDLFADVPEPEVDNAKKGFAVALEVAKATAYADLESAVFGRGASLDTPPIGFHAGEPKKVRAWWKKHGYTALPASELLDTITLVELDGPVPKQAYTFESKGGAAKEVRALGKNTLVLRRGKRARPLVTERGFASIGTEGVAKVALQAYGAKDAALAGTLRVLDYAVRMGFLKKSGTVIKQLVRRLEATAKALEKARGGGADEIRAALEGARPFIDSGGLWGHVLDSRGARTARLYNAHRAVGKAPAAARKPEPDVKATWKALHARHGKTGWPRPVSMSSLEAFEVTHDNFDMPEALWKSLRVHDGEKEGQPRLTPPHRMLSLEESIDAVTQAPATSPYRKHCAKGLWFLPLTTVEGGVGYALEMPDGQAKGVLALHRARKTKVADSFAAWLAALATADAGTAAKKKTNKKKRR